MVENNRFSRQNCRSSNYAGKDVAHKEATILTRVRQFKHDGNAAQILTGC